LLLLVIPANAAIAAALARHSAKAGIQCLGFAGMTSKKASARRPDITQRERGAIKP
jgi:hypothetical protein